MTSAELGDGPFFTATAGPEGEILQPEPAARSGWDSGQLRGPAVTGVLARAAEARLAGVSTKAALAPARATFDLFRPARLMPTTVDSEVVRLGRRIALVDSRLIQDGSAVARASVLFVACSEPTPSPDLDDLDLTPPEPSIGGDQSGQAYRTAGSPWVTSAVEVARHHVHDPRKYVWRQPSSVVADETPTPSSARPW